MTTPSENQHKQPGEQTQRTESEGSNAAQDSTEAGRLPYDSLPRDPNSQRIAGLFFELEDSRQGDDPTPKLTRMEMISSFDGILSSSDATRKLTLLVEKGILSKAEQKIGREQPYFLTDLGRQIAASDYAKEARNVAKLNRVRQTPPETTDQQSQGQSAAASKVELSDKELLVLTLLIDPTKFEIPRVSRISFRDIEMVFSGTLTKKVANSACQSLIKQGLVETKARSYYVATAAGVDCHRENAERAALLSRQALAVSAAQAAGAGESQSQLSLSDRISFAKAQGLLKGSSVYAELLKAVIQAAREDINGCARENPVDIALRKRGIQMTRLSIKFQTLRSVNLLDPLDRPTELAHRIAATLEPSQESGGTEQTKQQTDTSVFSDRAEVDSRANVTEASSATQDSGAGGLSWMDFLDREGCHEESDPILQPTLEPETSLAPHPGDEISDKAADAQSAEKSQVVTEGELVSELSEADSLLVAQTEVLAKQFEELAESVEKFPLRDGDKAHLASLPPDVASRLVPAARTLYAIEHSIGSSLGAKDLEYEVQNATVRVCIPSFNRQISSFFNHVGRRPEVLSSAFCITPVSEKEVSGDSVDRHVSTILTSLEGAVDALFQRYPALRADFAELAIYAGRLIENPLLDDQDKNSKFQQAASEFRKRTVLGFYTQAKSGYPSAADRGSEQAYKQVEQLCDTIKSNSPLALAVSFAAYRLSTSLAEALEFSRALLSCQPALRVAGISLTDVERADRPGKARLAQRSSLPIQNGDVTSRDTFEFKHLNVSGVGLVVEPRTIPPFFTLVAIRILPSTCLTDIVLLLQEFERQKIEALQKAPVDLRFNSRFPLGDGDLATSFRPPHSPAARITVTDGAHIRPDQVTDASFRLVMGFRPGSFLVEPCVSFASAAGIEKLRRELQDCLAYNLSLLDSVVHGSSKRALICNPPRETPSERIIIEAPPRSASFRAAAEWYRELASKVTSHKLIHEFLPLFTAVNPSPQAREALAGAGQVSSLLMHSRQLEAGHGVRLTRIESSADQVVIEFSIEEGSLVEELISTQVVALEPQATRTQKEPVSIGSAEAIERVSAQLSASSGTSVIGDFESYLQDLRYYEGVLFEGRIDTRAFHLSKARSLRALSRKQEVTHDFIGEIAALSSAELDVAASIALKFSAWDPSSRVETPLKVRRLLERVGFSKAVVSPLTAEVGKELFSTDYAKAVEGCGELDTDCARHLISDTWADGASYIIELMWDCRLSPLTPSVSKVFVTPHVDVDTLEAVFANIYAQIAQAVESGSIDRARAVQSLHVQSNSFYGRDGYVRTFSGFPNPGRGVWVSDGDVRVVEDERGLSRVSLTGSSYALKIVPACGSNVATFQRLVAPREKTVKSAHSDAAAGTVWEAVCAVTRYNASLFARDGE